jgi:hypothetical protein
MTQLVTLAEGVHTLESTLRIHPGFYLPVRSTLLRLDDGSLLMISPLRVDDALAARGMRWGGSRTSSLPATCTTCSWGRPPRGGRPHACTSRAGSPESWRGGAARCHPTDTLPAGLPSGVQGVLLDGVPDMDETLFFHAASRTLVVTDLVFHVLAPEGLLTGLILRMVGRTACSRRAARCAS